ncbi:MAG: cation-translocating P-type ATPase [Patescibacteria group bacterium]|nr:cation-translocating P-type ATPase [Patescibacteria group bacterium]
MSLSESEIKNLKGLSITEVKDRLKKDGYNELPSSEKRNIKKIIFEVFKEPMFLLLVLAGLVYLLLGDVQEAILLLGFVFVVIGITVYQENKTEKALDALKNMSSPRALVIRDGKHSRIAGREIVIDDIIILNEGDRVPADVVILWERNVLVDESLLTGESVPVRKNSAENEDEKYNKLERDDLLFLFSGSLVVQGQAISRVVATGIKTEMGKIGKALESIKDEQTPLQKQTKKIVRDIFAIVVILCLSIVLFYGFQRGDWLTGILSGITLAMAMLPEEFPVVLTIFLALGAWRIAQKKVLARKISAVEILGAATVLCVDKTGTLTQNKMSIKKIYNGSEFCDLEKDNKNKLSENFHELIEYGMLASKKDPFDPMEKALNELGKKILYNTEHVHKKWVLEKEYPLSRELLALSHVWGMNEKDGCTVSAKGAAEAIIDLCHFDLIKKEKIMKCVDKMALDGLRVIGVAKSYCENEKLPSSQHDFDFEFIGLIGLADPIRNSVPDAIRKCYSAGIRVIMITGDYSSTAQNIAKQIGLKNSDQAITGAELEKMNPFELQEKIKKINIFSRVVPEQKLFIVNALKSNGEIVAMTGDGVNDAPALKSSHIGVAMGERGTDVARESSGLVLLDDNFSTIVEAVKTGRRVYDNLKKAMAYIVSVHIPIAGISFFPVLFGWPIVLYPVHIVFLELIIDPACSIVFEAEKEEENIMKRFPRNPKNSLFGKNILFLSLLQGLFSLLAVALVFLIALKIGQTEGEARALAFVTLIISNIFLILTNRSWSKNIISSFRNKNKALSAVLLGATLFLSVALYYPSLRDIFHFDFMHPHDIIIALSAGILSIIWFEVVKYICMKKGIELLR